MDLQTRDELDEYLPGWCAWKWQDLDDQETWYAHAMHFLSTRRIALLFASWTSRNEYAPRCQNTTPHPQNQTIGHRQIPRNAGSAYNTFKFP